MAEIETVSWSSVLPQIRTGDLMLWSRPNDNISRALAAAADCPFSHVAMLVRADAGLRPQLWQTTTEAPVPDPIANGRAHPGAQLGDAEQVLTVMGNSQYGMIPYYRPLSLYRNDGFEREVMSAILAFDGIPFPSDADLAAHVVEGRMGNVDSGTADLFCAQLVAATYQRVMLLDGTHPPNWYNPGSFGGIGRFAGDCDLRRGAAWGGPAVRIAMPLA